jgi:hypothetical protein
MLSIIVLSSDGYSDCWNPIFTLFKKNFPCIENYELILSSNTKKYNHPDLEIRSLTHGKDMPWSKRLKQSLDQAKNEIVLVLVEDFFLLSKMNNSVFESLLKLIKTEDKIDHIRLVYNKSKVKVQNSKYKFLDEIVPKSKYRFLYLPGLWRKEVLQKYVVEFETPYVAEIIGNYRSWILNDGFYAISKNFLKNHGELYDCPTSGALIKGKWGKWLPKRLEENGIKINYSIRGFKDIQSNKKARIKAQLYFLNHPILTLKSIFMTLLLFFKR